MTEELYGPRTAEVERLIAGLGALSDDDWGRVVDAWCVTSERFQQEQLAALSVPAADPKQAELQRINRAASPRFNEKVAPLLTDRCAAADHLARVMAQNLLLSSALSWMIASLPAERQIAFPQEDWVTPLVGVAPLPMGTAETDEGVAAAVDAYVDALSHMRQDGWERIAEKNAADRAEQLAKQEAERRSPENQARERAADAVAAVARANGSEDVDFQEMAARELLHAVLAPDGDARTDGLCVALQPFTGAADAARLVGHDALTVAAPAILGNDR